MSDVDSTPDPLGEPAQTAAVDKQESKGTPPTKALPTDRIKMSKQLDILRAYGGADKGATNAVISEIVKLTPSTVSLGNAFWVDNEFITKGESGFQPAVEVKAFANAYEWNKETAAHKLAPLLTRTWFFEKLRPKLRYGELPEDAAIEDLAEAIGAAPRYKSQLVILLEYLAAANVISRENGTLKLVRSQSQNDSGGEANKGDPPKPLTPAATAQIQHAPSPIVHEGDKGGISMQFTIHVTMNEISRWQPDRIAAFFTGIAQVMAAKGKSGEEVG